MFRKLLTLKSVQYFSNDKFLKKLPALIGLYLSTVYRNLTVKGTVSRDFLLLVFS
jgi:hypothetical protein